MEFKPVYLKLTCFYVLVVMLISIAFSVVIYQLSAQEIDRSLNNQNNFLRQNPMSNVFLQFDQLENMRQEQQKTSNHNLMINLIYFNLLILVLSSVGSYFFARKTLNPVKEALDAQNRFTADASHELRTPLAAMKTEIEVNLRDSKFNFSKSKELLKSNLEEIDRLENLSEALLKLASYQDTKQIFKNKVSLEDTIVDAYSKLESLAQEKSISFENDLKDISVYADKDSLIELFVILIENAIKYSPKKSKIFISIKEDKNNAIISIKDQGVGIKSSDLPYIFERFYRADTSRNKEKIDGYGLGLSIAKEIVGMHKGSINITSKLGAGTTFTIKLPVKNQHLSFGNRL